jgi:hypothetical protein
MHPLLQRLAIVGVLSVCVEEVSAQQRTNFSGIWVRSDTLAERASVATVGDGAFRSGDMGAGWGTPLTVTQTADSLAIEYVFFSAYDLQPPLRLVYALDGGETRNDVMIGHATEVQRSRVTWRDGSLVITTRHPLPASVGSPGQTVEVRQTLTLASPTSLVVETVRSGALGAPAVATRTIYTKR